MSKCLRCERNITPFSSAMPTLPVCPYHPKGVIHQPIVLILNPRQRIGHLQSSNGMTVLTSHLPPRILTCRNRFFDPPQLLRHHPEPVYLGLERGVVEATDHLIGLVL